MELLMAPIGPQVGAYGLKSLGGATPSKTSQYYKTKEVKMKIPVKNKSRKSKVSVRVIPSMEQENVYIGEESYFTISDLAIQLSKLNPTELKRVYAAAKHLRKFAELTGYEFEEDNYEEK